MATDDITTRSRYSPEKGTPLWFEWRAKISAALKGRPKPPRTAEHIAKIKATKAKTPCPPKLLAFNKSRIGARWSHTAEAKAKIGAAKRGTKMPREAVERMARKRAATFIDRFWSYIQKSDGCWLWMRALDKDGYGDCHRAGVAKGAHRIAFALTYGSIPNGLSVLHKCDNPRCCRPDHLYAGTPADNVRDREERRRGERPYQRQ
jgi:hypothetical protein